MSPRRERVVRAFLKSAFRGQRLLPDHRTPLPERLDKKRRTPAQFREHERDT